MLQHIDLILSAIVALVAGIYSYRQKIKSSKLKEQQKEDLIESLQNEKLNIIQIFKLVRLNYKLDTKIYNILGNILIDYNALRVFLVQFHNGIIYYNGIHARRMSISHEKVRPGMEAMQLKFDNIGVNSEMHTILTTLEKENSLYVDNYDDLEDDNELKTGMDTYQCYSFLAVPIRCSVTDFNDNIIDATVAVLFLNFGIKKPLNKLKIEKIKQEATIIETIINKKVLNRLHNIEEEYSTITNN